MRNVTHSPWTRVFAGTGLILWTAVVASVYADQGPAHGKDSRTPAQQKIDSQLLQEIDRIRNPPQEQPATGVKIDRKHRALVDVRVEVTPAIQKRMRRVGGTVVNTSSKDHSIVVWMPLLKLEELAADPAVNAIIPAPEATIRK